MLELVRPRDLEALLEEPDARVRSFPDVTDAAPVIVSPRARVSGSSRRRASSTAFCPQCTASSLSSLTICVYALIP